MGEYDALLDCWITVCELPPHVNGLIKEKDGENIILINSSLSDNAKRKTLRHELRHLRRRDLRSEKSIAFIERD